MSETATEEPQSPTVPPADDPADLEEAESSVVPTVVTILALALVVQAATPEFGNLPEVKAAELLAKAAKSMGLAGWKGVVRALGARSSAAHGLTSPKSVSTASDAAGAAGESTLVQYAQSFARHVAESGRDLPRTLPEPDALKDEYGADIERVSRGVAQSARNAGVYAAAKEAGSVHKTWHSRNDKKVRPTHNVLDSHAWPEHTVLMDEPFISPSGVKLDYPGDPTAPLDETANCRCWVTFTMPKGGTPYGGEAAISPEGYNPPQMQGNPLAPPKNAPPIGVRFTTKGV